VDEEIANAVARIGENMSLRRSVGFLVSPGVVATYVHNQVAPGLGKIGVIVALESAGDAAKLGEFGRQVAMHIAAASPLSVSVADLDPALIERERQVLSEQARDSGKPEQIIAKMVEGRLRKYYEEVVLLEQVWVLDGESRVSAMVEQAAKDAGAPIAVKGFARFALGEGIEREEADFAAEVAAAAGTR
jgi:elongation factor Ts